MEVGVPDGHFAEDRATQPASNEAKQAGHKGGEETKSSDERQVSVVGKSKKLNEHDGQNGQELDEAKEEKRKKGKVEQHAKREWRRALRAKEDEYWDTLYDRGRRMVLGMGLPHDPLRGIQLLRRNHLPLSALNIIL
jgi:hypothetical protein